MKINDLYESSDNISQAIDTFKDKFPNTILYHGTTRRVDTTKKHEFHFRKSSKDTPPIINLIINRLLESEYGLPIRNLLFTTQSYEIADAYGEVYAVIPVGKYRLFYSEEIDDFTAHFGMDDMIEKTLSRTIDNYDDDEQIKQLVEKYNKYLHPIIQVTSEEELYNIRKNIPYYSESDEEVFSEFLEQFIDELWMDVENIVNDFYHVEEIQSSSDLPPETTEIMGYFPDGFYLVPHDDERLPGNA